MPNPKHNNPTRPREDRDRRSYQAHAPYNFVPLPDNMVRANPPLEHDRYHPEGHTGWIECTLRTCSPTYVRGMLTAGKDGQFEQLGNKKSDELSIKEKEELAPFFNVSGEDNPVVPGSSLRGMVRTLVEVIGYGRMPWVAAEPTFTYRAVAASNDDPLRAPYQDIMGRFGRNIRAGYLEQDADNWYIRPAFTPESQGMAERQGYLKVKENQIKGQAITNYVRLHSHNYHPQWHKVSFDVQSPRGKRGKYTALTNITNRRNNNQPKGVLVCSGNMLETNPQGELRRKNCAVILEANLQTPRLPIKPAAIEAYQAGLTEYQRDMLGKYWAGGDLGCLKNGAPVFYVAAGNEVHYFGHSPNFRIPAHVYGTEKAATPLDFVPKHLYDSEKPGLADVIFGWVSEPKASGLQDACAGRVFFEDAEFVKADNGLWLTPKHLITPSPLASPKPTTFQHYLVQDKQQGHNPDLKKTLAYYGTSPQETEIRGYKFYWTKGENPPLEASFKERTDKESQLTRIKPLKPGVHFRFKIHFENLRDEELGALLWAITLPGEPEKQYCHRLGMGKPLGMGAVTLQPTLHLTDRTQRYRNLFADNNWFKAEQTAEISSFVSRFEHFILDDRGVAPRKKRLADLERIQMLLKLHEWREGMPAWLAETRYMEIEGGDDKVNEYKERPVLPDPFGVENQYQARKKEKTVTKPRSLSPSIINIAGNATATSTVTGTLTVIHADSRQTGVVKVFGLGAGKTFGFIKPNDGGEDLFVHRRHLVGVQSLNRGDKVTFKKIRGMKGWEARQVVLI